jgi:hypothetical protein
MAMAYSKAAEKLTVEDIAKYSVWRFVNNDALGETLVTPVKKLPATDISGKLVGTAVRLANGAMVWAILGNISPRHKQKTQHFITISVERDGSWFHLARYFDPLRDQYGPMSLANFLGLSIDEVFPIAYDIRGVAEGPADVLSGSIAAEPAERLDDDQRMTLLFEALEAEMD